MAAKNRNKIQKYLEAAEIEHLANVELYKNVALELDEYNKYGLLSDLIVRKKNGDDAEFDAMVKKAINSENLVCIEHGVLGTGEEYVMTYNLPDKEDVDGVLNEIAGRLIVEDLFGSDVDGSIPGKYIECETTTDEHLESLAREFTKGVAA